MPYVVSGQIGIDLTDVSATAKFTPGTTVQLNDGGEAIYVQALSEISTYAAVLLTLSTFKAQMSTTTLAGASKTIAFAQTSIPSAYYGWVQRGGRPLVNLAANCAPSVPLYTTATSGVLDDATVSAGIVAGTVAETSISNATAVTINSSNPHIISVG